MPTNESASTAGRSSWTRQGVLWVIAGLLALNALGLFWRGASTLPTAWAQNQPMAGSRGIFAFTGPLDKDTYGLFMLDVDQGTVWCYEIQPYEGTRRLRLIAARTFIYDRYLQDFNCAPPDFRMVKQLVTQQRLEAEPSPSGPLDVDPNRADNPPARVPTSGPTTP
jgi:hypothetical protein